MLSEEAKAKKSAYNLKRNKELTKLFAARLPINEYEEICNYLKSQRINKAEFVRRAYNELKNRGEDSWKWQSTGRFSKRDERTRLRTRDNQLNNVEINNNEETTNVYGLSNDNKRQTGSVEQSDNEINRNKTNEGLDNSSFTL